jgi:PAS domain-containing protein
MNDLPTNYNLEERADQNTILGDASFLEKYGNLSDILNASPYIGLLLNEQRQVVFSNNNLQKVLGVSGLEQILGKRPGELFDCVNAYLEPGGCGTSECCQLCGAARVINESINTGKRTSGECRISSGWGRTSKSWDFLCIATPLPINKKTYTVVSLLDISHEKRRRALEKIFFHDLINTATGLDGLIDYIRELNQQQETKKHLDVVHRLSKSLIDEIQSQRELSNAENDELVPRIQNVYSLDLVSNAVHQLAFHRLSKNKEITIDPESDNICFKSDPVLLRRILINMLKNALEAIDIDQEVNIGCKHDENNVIFWVHNPGIIPADVQKQIFQRSFSTKGVDRGLGTYSMRLLSEKYLNGKVSFKSSEPAGTVFRISLPLI